MFKIIIFRGDETVLESVVKTLSEVQKSIDTFADLVINRFVSSSDSFIPELKQLTALDFSADCKSFLHLDEGINTIFGVGIGYSVLINNQLVDYDLQIIPYCDIKTAQVVEKKNTRKAKVELKKVKREIEKAQKINARETMKREKAKINLALLKKHGLL